MKKRSGSEKRRATVQRNFRFTPAHHAALCKLAEAHGQSLSALVLNTLLNVPLPRVHRPRVDDKLMRQFFVEIARARDALKPSEAELGKIRLKPQPDHPCPEYRPRTGERHEHSGSRPSGPSGSAPGT